MKANLKIMIATFLLSLTKNHIYVAKAGLAKGLKLKGGLSFIPRPLTSEETFLTKLELRNLTVYDVGGASGIFTLFFSRCVGENGKVFTYEPNPVNVDAIMGHLRLNKINNVQVRQIALGASGGQGTLVFPSTFLGSGRGSLHADIQASILEEKRYSSITVQIDTLDNQIMANSLPKPDFIKIDVEGLEKDVLYGMRSTISKYKPSLFIEIHGVDVESKIENAHSVVKFLLNQGYSIRHVESDNFIDISNSQIAKEGHLYCF